MKPRSTFPKSHQAGTTASSYGFNSSTGGTAAKTYTVNGTTCTVLDLLQQANTAKKNGTFDANYWNTVFDGINTTGDIK